MTKRKEAKINPVDKCLNAADEIGGDAYEAGYLAGWNAAWAKGLAAIKEAMGGQDGSSGADVDRVRSKQGAPEPRWVKAFDERARYVRGETGLALVSPPRRGRRRLPS